MDYNILEDLEYIELPLVNSDQKILVDGDYDGEYFGSFSWYVQPTGYVVRLNTGDNRPKQRAGLRHAGSTTYLHHLVLPPKPGYWVTFRDGNKLNCRSCNVIYRTPSESAYARPVSDKVRKPKPRVARGGKYGYRGVVKSSGYGYRAQFRRGMSQGRSWPTAEQAAREYDRRAYEYWGDKAILNFPHEKS